MPKEIELSDAQRTAILHQEESAQKDTRLLKWLSELSQQKNVVLSEKKKQIANLQQELPLLEDELKEIKAHADQLISTSKNTYKKILESIISELGIPPNSKIQLLFEAGVPRINLLDDVRH